MGVWRQLVGFWGRVMGWVQSEPERAFCLGLVMLLGAWLSRIVLSLFAISLIGASIHRMFFDQARM